MRCNPISTSLLHWPTSSRSSFTSLPLHSISNGHIFLSNSHLAFSLPHLPPRSETFSISHILPKSEALAPSSIASQSQIRSPSHLSLSPSLNLELEESGDLMGQAKVFLYANGKDQPPTAIDFDKSLLRDLLFNQSPTKDSVAWTDEKHSMYLKSMEASFVHQLYNSCRQGEPSGLGQPKAHQHGKWQKTFYRTSPYTHFRAMGNDAFEQQPLGVGGHMLSSRRPYGDFPPKLCVFGEG